MQIASRFTIAVHIVACIDYFQKSTSVTSAFLAGSVGVNRVVIRTLMTKLKEAGIIAISRGKTGVRLGRRSEEISLYDVYKAVESVDESGLFNWHSSPNPLCPVGKNVRRALGETLVKAQLSMEKELKSATIADLTAELHKVAD